MLAQYGNRYLWNRNIYVGSHNLTSLTNRSSYEIPASYRKNNVWRYPRVMVGRIQDQRIPITMAYMWSLVASSAQGMQSEF
jgi:hypothetical protein